MLYEIMQFYEDGNLRYSIQAIGKRTEYPKVTYLDGEQLLGALHDCKKYDKKPEFQFPQIQVAPVAMSAVKEAFEKGYLSVHPTKVDVDSCRTTPMEVIA